MNIILFEESELISGDKVRLDGRRFRHIRDVHRAQLGDQLRVGKVNGLMGSGVVTALSDESVEIDIELSQPPPAPLDLTLFLALPRPKFLAKILQSATSLGIKRIFLFNSYRVDKVYWSCDQLKSESVRNSCLLGLEQARDTILPEIHQRRLFKPFVEDELKKLIEGTRALVAHPGSEISCPYNVSGPISLAVGPEGGFIDYELEKLTNVGFQKVRTLDRILKVETAVSSLVGRLK